MPEYRAVPAERRRDYHEVLEYAFAPETGPQFDDPDGEWPPTLFDARALFDGDDLVATSKLYYLDAWVREGWATVGGLGGVASPPERRREGHVRTLLREALREYREHDVDLVALWPFSTPFYRRLGWGTTGSHVRYDLPPRQLATTTDAPGSVRRLSPDEVGRLAPIEAARGEGVALSLRRSERWWRERTLAGWDGENDAYCYGYERDGDLRGYVAYRIERGDGGRVLKVDDLAALDDAAERALLDFLADHDSQVETVRLDRADDGDFLYRVDDPGAVDASVEVEPMTRIVDVGAALEDYPWPEDLEATVALAVEDPLLERNDGTFEVGIRDGAAAVRRRDDGTADATVDVPTLSQAYVGAVDVETAERAGGLTVRDAAAREALDAAFPEQPVWLREFF